MLQVLPRGRCKRLDHWSMSPECILWTSNNGAYKLRTGDTLFLCWVCRAGVKFGHQHRVLTGTLVQTMVGTTLSHRWSWALSPSTCTWPNTGFFVGGNIYMYCSFQDKKEVYTQKRLVVVLWYSSETNARLMTTLPVASINFQRDVSTALTLSPLLTKKNCELFALRCAMYHHVLQ